MKKSVAFLDYCSTTYDSLLEFQEAKLNSYTSNKKIIQLGNIICEYGLQDKIGLCLLHKHFNINSDEVLLRKVIRNCAVTSPTSFLKKQLIPYMWKIDGNFDSEHYNLCPLEFVMPNVNSTVIKRIASINKILYSKADFLFEFANKLIELKLTNAFGISILNSCFLTKSMDETFLETTNEGLKKLTLKPTNREVLINETIQTQWIFTPSNSTAGTACTHCSHGNCGHCFHS